MESDEVRRGYAARGILGQSPWVIGDYKHSAVQINLGNNFISLLEIVSSLNLFNLARYYYLFNYETCALKYNPKVYLGTIQTSSKEWNYDRDYSRKNLGPDGQKSGSCNYIYNPLA